MHSQQQSNPVIQKCVAWVIEYTDRLGQLNSTLARNETGPVERYWATMEQAFILGEISGLLAMMELELGEKTVH